jgi:hypothetical protein
MLALAASQALLDDPARSQNLMSVALTVLGQDGLRELLHKVSSVGGDDEFRSFQLLFNQMHSSLLSCVIPKVDARRLSR